MTSTTDPQRRSFLLTLSEHNIFYLLSAACMLAGCLLLSNTMTWSPIPLKRLIPLIVTLNVYEILLVGLGLFLIVRKKLWHDGTMLLVLEALFLVDIGFLNAEVFQQSQRIGWIVNAVIFLLALVKLLIIFRALKLPVSPVLALLILAFALLFAAPGVLKALSTAGRSTGQVSPQVFYLWWWVVGLLGAAYALLARFLPIGRPWTHPTATSIAHTFIILCLLSIAAHLGTAHWIYGTAFSAPDLSPGLLALAMMLPLAQPSKAASRRDLRMLCAALPVAAVWTATSIVPELRVNARLLWTDIRITPLLLTLPAAYIVLTYLFALRYMLRLLVAGAAVGLIYLFGPSRQTTVDGLVRAWRGTIGFIRGLMPTTQTAWGILAIVSAFVLLGIGAVLSLYRAARPAPEPATPPPVPPAPDA